jgi:transcriptional regulator with XRE-family HTH domain
MRIRTTRDLAMMVREARLVNHLTQADLAEQLGVSRAWIIRLEQGAQRIELGLTLRALRALRLETNVRFPQPFE